MNKLIKSLLVAALAVSASHLQAADTVVTNKTTLVPRSHGVNVALENTAGWYDLIHRKSEDKFGGNFQAAFFYAASTNKKELGKYFGVAGQNVFTFGTNDIAAEVNNEDLDARYFIHDRQAAPGADTKLSTISLNPEQKAIGVYFNYHQDFCKILNGLYLRVNLPVVNVENNMNLKVEGDAANVKITQDFLAGNLDRTDAASVGAGNAQAKLTNALITGNKESKTGVADIDVILGYDFLQNDKYHASINLGVTIPTGTQPDGKKVFAATIGNGQHVGFGGGLDFGAQVTGDDDGGMKLHGQVNYRYLFQGKEKRTIGIKDPNLLIGGWQQYALLQAYSAPANSALIPAANVLTQDVNVTPGSQLDAIVALGYNIWGLAFDLGYNVYYREAETVSLKNKFDDTKYAIAARNWDTTTGAGFPANAAGLGNNGTALTSQNIDVAAAANSSQTTHKIYGGVAYYAKDWETPVLFGVGGHYEFAANNAVEGWGVNAKAGLSF